MSKGHVTTLPYPFSFCIIQPLLESIHYHFIDGLDLSIPLWISRGEIPIHNAYVTTIPPKGFAIKLKVVVRDEGMRNPKPGDNIFPNKSLNIYVPDIYQWFSFNPLDEALCANQ